MLCSKVQKVYSFIIQKKKKFAWQIGQGRQRKEDNLLKPDFAEILLDHFKQ